MDSAAPVAGHDDIQQKRSRGLIPSRPQIEVVAVEHASAQVIVIPGSHRWIYPQFILH